MAVLASVVKADDPGGSNVAMKLEESPVPDRESVVLDFVRVKKGRAEVLGAHGGDRIEHRVDDLVPVQATKFRLMAVPAPAHAGCGSRGRRAAAAPVHRNRGP
jgi:hypothetical protein